MKFQSSIYKQVNGYFLIESYLVPEYFLERLYEEVKDDEIFTFVTTPLEWDLEFWDSLTEYEQDIVEPCMLILLENDLLNFI